MLKWLSNVCFYLNYLVFADDGVAPNQNGGSVESEQSDGSAESEQGKMFMLNSQLSNVRVQQQLGDPAPRQQQPGAPAPCQQQRWKMGDFGL